MLGAGDSPSPLASLGATGAPRLCPTLLRKVVEPGFCMFEGSNLLFDQRSGWHSVERARCRRGERDCSGLGTAPRPSRREGPDPLRGSVQVCSANLSNSSRFMHVSSNLALGQRKRLADEVRFELTCRNYPTIRFRVGAVMTASVPLRAQNCDKGLGTGPEIGTGLRGARILAERCKEPRGEKTSRPGGLSWPSE